MNTNELLMSGCSVRRLLVGSLAGCMMLGGSVVAAPLPKGHCADPKPYTDLRHCKFEGADLRNKDLRGADLRGIFFYNTQLQGSNLTGALFGGDGIMYAALEDTKGLPKEGLVIYNQNYLVLSKGGSNSSIKLSPHVAVQGIQENIAGQNNIHMVKKTEDKLHTFAVLDWPRNGEGGMKTIVARFDNESFDVPACSRSVDLLTDGRYFYPHWDSMVIKSLRDGYLIGVTAGSTDADGEGVGGWGVIAFLKLSRTCDLSILHKEDTGWAEGPEAVGCVPEYLDIRFLDEQTAEIKITGHTCQSLAKSRPNISYKKVKFNSNN